MSNIQKGRFMGAVRMGWIGPGAAARLREMNLVQDRRIAIDARWVFRELSGIGRYTLELLKQLGEIGGAFRYLVLVRIAVAPDGVDARYAPGGEKPSARGAPPTVLYVGRRDPYKNLPGLVAAFARLVRDGGVDARLRVVGPPDARYPEAEEAARRLGVAEHVEWTGYLDDAGLLRAYQDADVLALLSKYEGFGLPVAEAMACGTPVVCSNAASLPEVAGAAARLVAPDDVAGAAAALQDVLTNPAEAARLRAAGLEQARKFSWRAAAESMLRLYGGEGAP